MENEKKKRFIRLHKPIIMQMEDESTRLFWGLGKRFSEIKEDELYKAAGIDNWREYVREEVDLDLYTVEDFIDIYETFEPSKRDFRERLLFRRLGWSKVQVLANHYDLFGEPIETGFLKFEEILMFGIQHPRRDLKDILSKDEDKITLWSRIFGRIHFPLRGLSSELEIISAGISEVLNDLENRYELSLRDRVSHLESHCSEGEKAKAKEFAKILSELRGIKQSLKSFSRLKLLYEHPNEGDDLLFELLVGDHGIRPQIPPTGLEFWFAWRDLSGKDFPREESLGALNMDETRLAEWENLGYLDTDQSEHNENREAPSDRYSLKVLKKAYLLKKNFDEGVSMEEALEKTEKEMKKAKIKNKFLLTYYGLLRRIVKIRERLGEHSSADDLRMDIWKLYMPISD